MTDEKKVITDMNDRERDRFIASLEAMQGATTELLEALRTRNDERLLVPAMMFTMSIVTLQDLFKVLATAQQVDMGDLDKPFGFGPDGT